MSAAASVDVNQVMSELGLLRRFHVATYLRIWLVFFMTSHYTKNYVFLAADVNYRCVVPECEARNSTQFSQPWTAHALPGAGREARCSRRAPAPAPAPAPADCRDPAAFSDALLACDSWLYADNNTIVAEFGLACQEWKRTLVGSVHNLGMFVSLSIFGYISDKFGRKTALILSGTLVGAMGTLKAFSISYPMYVILEFLEAGACSGACPAAYVLNIELLSEKKRVLLTTLTGFVMVLGGISFALIAKTFQYWRTYLLVVYPPAILFLLYSYFQTESIRWLLSKGRKKEAVDAIINAAKINNVTLSEETMLQLTAEKPQNDNKVETQGIWKQVFQSPIIRMRLLICSWWWITCAFVFYGLAINSVSLAGDKYTNYMLVVSVELVALALNILLLDRIGRKKTLIIAFTVCGVACLSIVFVPKDMSWLVLLLYLLGKVTITQAFGGIYMYTSELFPTSARNSLLSTCSMLGRLGSIVSPQMPLLALYVNWLPSVLFGSTALVAGALMLLTPETLHTRLPDTIADAEALATRAPPPAAASDAARETSRC